MIQKSKASFVGILIDSQEMVFQAGSEAKKLRKANGRIPKLPKDFPGFALSGLSEGRAYEFLLEEQVMDGAESPITLDTIVLGMRLVENRSPMWDFSEKNLVLV